ncbi:MAG TPA: hypothetical protein VFC58_07610 [Desulfosporosinus sp.]|nr:hypothetical protein [Desulfosporosinus sp.]
MKQKAPRANAPGVFDNYPAARIPPRNGNRTIRQMPLGEAISIRLRTLMTAPGGMATLSRVPGNGPHLEHEEVC